MDPKVKAASDVLDKAAAALHLATRKALPLGCLVEVKLGVAIVRGRVIGYGPSWSIGSASDVRIQNIYTDKVRTFSAASEAYPWERL